MFVIFTLIHLSLTHWLLDKMVNILQTTFTNSFAHCYRKSISIIDPFVLIISRYIEFLPSHFKRSLLRYIEIYRVGDNRTVNMSTSLRILSLWLIWRKSVVTKTTPPPGKSLSHSRSAVFGEMCRSASCPDVNKPRGSHFETTSAFHVD